MEQYYIVDYPQQKRAGSVAERYKKSQQIDNGLCSELFQKICFLEFEKDDRAKYLVTQVSKAFNQEHRKLYGDETYEKLDELKDFLFPHTKGDISELGTYRVSLVNLMDKTGASSASKMKIGGFNIEIVTEKNISSPAISYICKLPAITDLLLDACSRLYELITTRCIPELFSMPLTDSDLDSKVRDILLGSTTGAFIRKYGSVSKLLNNTTSQIVLDYMRDKYGLEKTIKKKDLADELRKRFF